MTTTITTGDGCRIAYRFDGPEGAPVLLLSNSLGTSLAMWEPQLAAFTQHFRVLRYDGRGHGQSGVPAGSYSLDRLGRDVIELLDTLALDIVDVCGVSLGGMIGQWLGIREPARVRRIIIANSSAYMGPPSGWDARITTVREQGMPPLAEASVARWFTPSFPAKHQQVVEVIRSGLLATHPQGYAGCCAAIRDMDMRRLTTLIQTPTLIIAGKQDPSTPPVHSEALVRAIAGARLELLDAAHLSNVEAPEAFTAAVLGFLTAQT